jgi:hypothetical protein
MNDLFRKLANMTPEQLEGALIALDAVSAMLGTTEATGGQGKTLEAVEGTSASCLKASKPPFFRPRAQHFPEPCPNPSRKGGA